MKPPQWTALHAALRNLRTNGMTSQVRAELDALVRSMGPRDKQDFLAALKDVHASNQRKGLIK